MGLNFEREDFRREAALAKEQERVAKKEAKREKMMNRSSYRIMVKTAKYMANIISIRSSDSFREVSETCFRVPWPCRSSTTVCVW